MSKHETLAARINSAHLSAFFDQTTELELLRLTYYFGQAFSDVGGADYKWLKAFSNKPLTGFVDAPFCIISEDVYRISTKWIDRQSDAWLKSFVVFLCNSIISGKEIHELIGDSYEGRKLPIVQKENYGYSGRNGQVELFIMLSIILRRRPHVLIDSLPLLRDVSKCQSEDELLLFCWMIAQAAEVDITVGLYTWMRNMLPVLGGKSGSSKKSRDLVLQVVERIIAVPNALDVLCHGATRNGERLISTSALESLLRLTFSPDYAEAKDAQRLQAIYPTLILVAVEFKSTEMKLVSKQIQPLALKLAGEDTPSLSAKAARLFFWCLVKTPADSCRYWRATYMDNLKASVLALDSLRQYWKIAAPVLSNRILGFTIIGFLQQNKKTYAKGEDAAMIKQSNEHSMKLLKMITGDIWWPVKISVTCWPNLFFRVVLRA